MPKGQGKCKMAPQGFSNAYACPCGYTFTSLLEIDAQRSRTTNKLKIRLHQKVCNIAKELGSELMTDIADPKDKKKLRELHMKHSRLTDQQIRCNSLATTLDALNKD